MPTPTLRTKLRQAIASLAAEKHNLDELEQARTRARESSWHLASQQRDAETQLRQAQAHEPSRIARAYISGDLGGVTPVEAAQASVDQAQQDYLKVEQVEAALTSEITTATRALQDAQTRVHAALSELICNSPEYDALVAEHQAAWVRLRTVKVTLANIMNALHGQYPERLSELVTLSEPLEKRVGYPVGELVDTWADALHQLLEDPDAPLPPPI